MPGGDRTGPMGAGPRTGRAAGFCSGYDMPGYANPGFGRGAWPRYGRGRGFARWGAGGRGWRNRFRATGIPGIGRWWQGEYMGPADEKEILKNSEARLQSELEMIRKRLSELEADAS